MVIHQNKNIESKNENGKYYVDADQTGNVKRGSEMERK
jgi:hypothetical protein